MSSFPGLDLHNSAQSIAPAAVDPANPPYAPGHPLAPAAHGPHVAAAPYAGM
ncbi:hypothetical protein FRB94_001099 [Tulasnella sp. JGI-2019a]|nr:hypothetical protein FRB94_001099 [Tulasnella sp. JGI-2019a]